LSIAKRRKSNISVARAGPLIAASVALKWRLQKSLTCAV